MILNTKRRILRSISKLKVLGKPKIFCVGLNKTGTTSLKKLFTKLGYAVGNQRHAELLMTDYYNNNFNSIIKYSKTAQVFQDAPFSLKETFIHLDKAFPKAKFILTIRNSSDQWYDSLTKFHSIKFGGGELPTAQKLKDVDYVYKGWVWENISKLFGTNEFEPYEKERLTKYYDQHNEAIIEYFANRPNKLLVINLQEKGSFSLFCNFLEIKTTLNEFPWENRTNQMKINK